MTFILSNSDFSWVVGCWRSSQLCGAIKEFYMAGYATKDDYAKALRAHQAYLDDIKSSDRDKAAAAFDDYKYYE